MTDEIGKETVKDRSLVMTAPARAVTITAPNV